MKNHRHLIALMVAILSIGTIHAQSTGIHRSNKSQDPWDIMMTTLYHNYIDTTGMSIVTPIDADLLYIITPDLTKAFHVKEKVDLSRDSTLGDVICSFMRVKYAGCSGQTYDYYKYRYSNYLIYDKYLERYPNSPYADEMRMKSECLKQYTAWSNCIDVDDCLDMLWAYEPSECPYGGFANIASMNNETRETATLFVLSMWSQSNDGNFDTYDRSNDDDEGYIWRERTLKL